MRTLFRYLLAAFGAWFLGARLTSAEIWPDEGLDLVLTYFPRSGTLPGNTWMGLFTTFTASTVTTSSGAEHVGSYSEPGSGAYARQTISSTSWGAPAAGTGGRKSTAGQVTFATATAAWNTINGFYIASSLTTGQGTVYFAANFDDVTAVNIQSSDVIKVTPTAQYNN